MIVTIEFYRVRSQDDAHAVLKRIRCEVTDQADAVAKAHRIARSADMPQTPDLFRILDPEGGELLSSEFSPRQKAAWQEADPRD